MSYYLKWVSWITRCFFFLIQSVNFCFLISVEGILTDLWIFLSLPALHLSPYILSLIFWFVNSSLLGLSTFPVPFSHFKIKTTPPPKKKTSRLLLYTLSLETLNNGPHFICFPSLRGHCPCCLVSVIFKKLWLTYLV